MGLALHTVLRVARYAQRIKAGLLLVPGNDMASNFTLEGLQSLARMIETKLYEERLSIKEFSRQAGISDGTVRNILKNLNLISNPHQPDISTLEAIAPLLTNPQTNKSFTIEEIYRLCKGWLNAVD